LKRVFRFGVLAGIAYTFWRWFESHRTETRSEWEAQPFPYPPQPRTSSDANRGPTGASDAALAAAPATVQQRGGTATAEWVEPVDGACPSSHPVKAKMSSKIFHVPGGLNYERTVPDRCYLDPAAAEADGLRQSKR
jgi:hypothetical protein